MLIMVSYRNKSYANIFVSLEIFNLLLAVGSLNDLDSQLADETKCFHKLTMPDGEFSSPNYPRLHPDGIRCTWLISAKHGKRINLIFDDFELEESRGCGLQSLTIFDGNSTNSTLLGNLCGTAIQHQLFSSSNEMLVILNTAKLTSTKGFHAVYTTYSCGGVVNTSNGILHSPFFPNFYQSKSNCIWRIPVKLHHRVILNITIFTVKTEEAEEPSCNENYVRISSPDAVNRTKGQELCCGSIFLAPLAIQSEGSELEVEYSSSNLIGSIFAATFDTVQDVCSLNISDCEQLCEKTVDGYLCSCRNGYELNGDGHSCSFVNASYSLHTTGFGEIISAGFPLKYAAYHRCTWEIKGNQDEQIMLKFEDFDVEYSPGCRYDAVEILEEHDNVSTTLGIYCGHDVPMPITSSRNNIVIYFRTDGLLEKKGFKITYMTSKMCGGTIALGLNSSKEIITSPFYPGAYPDNLHCVWEITAPPVHAIVFNFTTFDLHSTTEQEDQVFSLPFPICKAPLPLSGLTAPDQVLIVNNNPENETITYGSLSGSHLPSQLIADVNTIKVKFISFKPNGKETGFSAEVYSEKNECLINNGGCTHLCTKEIGSYQCTCPKGFILKHNTDNCVEDVCQYEIFATSGEIRTPDFQYIHPINNTCHWLITTDENKKLVMNFTMISPAPSTSDSLELYFGNNSATNSSINLCSDNFPIEITSPGNQIYLIYSRNNPNQTAKFLASFSSANNYCTLNNGGCQHNCLDSSDGYECRCHFGYVLHENKHNCTAGPCVYTFTTDAGHFESPNYPNLYPNGVECIWFLKPGVPSGILHLKFTTFNVEHHSHCAYDRVNIFDGDSENSSSLGYFCGSQLPPTISTTGNSLYMTFKSDAYTSFRGFSATYNSEIRFSECGSNIFVENEQELTLISHREFRTENYHNNYNCVWQITAAAPKRIIIRFYMLDLEVEATCNYDYVAIYQEDGSLISKLCKPGGHEGDIFTSKSNIIRVEFKSDSGGTGRGFAARVRSI